jgi:serine/threonine-protein kinase
VVSQQPVAGTQLPKDSRVLLNVSSGPNPQPLQTVPNVLAEEQSSAVSRLRQAGFQVVSLRQPVTDPSQQGLVVDEQPAGSLRIPAGSQVTLLVGSP